MRKTFSLNIKDRHRDRVVDAIKHDIHKYLRRERRRALPEGADYWDFDCRFGPSADAAQSVHVALLGACIDAIAATPGPEGAQCYVEILARPALRRGKAAGADAAGAAGATDAPASPAASTDA